MHGPMQTSHLALLFIRRNFTLSPQPGTISVAGAPGPSDLALAQRRVRLAVGRLHQLVPVRLAHQAAAQHVVPVALHQMAAALRALEALEMEHVVLRDRLAVVVVVVIVVVVVVDGSVLIVVVVGGVVQVVVYRRVGRRSHHELVGGYRLMAGGTSTGTE